MSTVTIDLNHLNRTELQALHEMLESRFMRCDAHVRRHLDRSHSTATVDRAIERKAEAERDFARVDAEMVQRDLDAAGL